MDDHGDNCSTTWGHILLWFQSLAERVQEGTIFFKAHPLNPGYFGNEEEREWMVKEVTGYFPSFFGYWKKVEKQLHHLKKDQ
jgi:hypothetical protein